MAVPGLTPTAAQVAAEAEHLQGEKDGVEIDQGIFLAHVLASETAGRHLCHAMLLPRRETAEHLQKFAADGRIDFGKVLIERRGKAAIVTSKNARFLNAEDDTTLDAMETAVDVAILDAKTDIAVLRGGDVEHPKYRGKKLFGAGINLTHLYRGQIPFVWFLRRDLGFVHKFFRGVARPELLPDDVHGTAIEKPWIAAVEGFAIGGHCQILLTMDYVLAANDAFMTLAGAQGRHHSGRSEPAPAALHRRPHRPPGHPIRAQARLRQPGRPPDLRRDRAGRRDGRGPRKGHRRAHQLRRGQRHLEPPRAAHRRRRRSTHSGCIFPLTPATRPIAISVPRSSPISSASGMRITGRFDIPAIRSKGGENPGVPIQPVRLISVLDAATQIA